jgi:adenylosuccinate lyase
MNDSTAHETYRSVFAWRYGTPAMRRIWSEENKRKLWRRVWLALAQAQQEAGLVSNEQVEDLREHVDDVDMDRAAEIEAQIHHDLMAELRTFAEQCPVGGPIIHLGATSSDVQENADALRIREALGLVIELLSKVLGALAGQVERWADTACMGFTHIQPAEPTTLGYRLAFYAQDLHADLLELRRVRTGLRGKGIKGAVGSSASFAQLLVESGLTPADLEARVMETLSLSAFPVTTQVSPRKQDWHVLNGLAGLAASIHKLAFDLRLLQSPPLGEWSEPFGAHQVGSSAMPFKRNPIQAENLDSLARLIASLPRVAWDNAALSLLERTLDDSANRRVILPQAFLATDELLRVTLRVVEGLRVDQEAIARNLTTYGAFAASERVLMELVKAGADRQAMHEVLRAHSLTAWAAIQEGRDNPLPAVLADDSQLQAYLSHDRILSLMQAEGYVGNAPQRARDLAAVVRAELA